MTAKEMFEELGYKFSNDDGYFRYLKGEPIPNRINTEYINFKEISFDRLEQEISIYTYKKDSLCLELLENATPMKMNFLSVKELKAINKQVEELGWNNA